MKLVDFLAEDIHNTLPHTTLLEIVKFRPVVVESEGDSGINQCYALKGSDDVVEFGGVRLQELAPYRDIIEQILHHEVATYGA